MKKSIFRKVGTILLGMALAFTPMLLGCSDGSGDSAVPEIPGNDKPGIENPETPELPGEIETPDVSGDVPNIGITNPDVEIPAGSDVFPANGAENVYEDTTLYIKAPNAEITRDANKVVKIYENDTVVATIDSKDATLYAFGMSGNIKQIKVNKQMISVQGDYVAIKIPSGSDAKSSVLEYGKTYSVEVSDGLISGYTPVAKENWQFTVRAKPSINVSNITVGKGKDFQSLQGAFNYLMTENTTGDVTINVDAGQYNERLTYKGNANVTIIGQGIERYGADTLFYWANMNGPTQNSTPQIDKNGEWWNNDTRDRAMFLWQGGNLKLKNVGFKNTSADYSGGIITQAEAIYFDSKKELVAYNSSFYSYQDTVLVGANGGKCWFYECYIEGSVDYMWGTADVALFEKCLIHSKGYNDAATSSYLFASRTPYAEAKTSKGFVLLNSDVLIGNNVTQYYGRSPAAGHETQATVINCRFSSKGTGTLSDKLWLSPGFNYVDVRGIGAVAYKDYGNYLNGSLVSGDKRLDKTYGLDDFIANREYNGREAIFNRVYSVKNEKYEFDTTKFDADSYATELGFTLATDASKNNLFIEPMFTDNLVGGSTVDYTVVDISGNAATVNWTTGDKNIVTVANGKATAATGVDGKTVSIGAVSGNKSGLAYIKVIAEEIAVETVTVAAKDATLNLCGLTTVTATLSGNGGKLPTNTEVTWTTNDTKIRFFDDGELKNTVTTTKDTVTVLAEKSGSFDITATSAEGPSGKATITVSEYVTEWNPTLAGIKVNSDPQNGTVAMFSGIIVDTKTSGKMASKPGNTSQQTRDVDLYIPIDRDATIKFEFTSAPSETNKITNANATTIGTTTTVPVTYEGAVDGSTTKNPTIGEGKENAKAKKYAKIEFAGTLYITKITRTYAEGSEPVDDGGSGNEPVVEGFVGKINFRNDDNKDVAHSTVLDDIVSEDGFVKAEKLKSNGDGNSAAFTSSDSKITVTVDGPCELALDTTYAGTNNSSLTVKNGNEFLVNAGTYKDGTVLKFIYTGTDVATLEITFGSGYMYVGSLAVTKGASENEVIGVTVSGDKHTVTVNGTLALTATVSTKFLNDMDKTVTWSSDAESIATIENGTVTGVAGGTANITATCGTVVSAAYQVTVSSYSVEDFNLGSNPFVHVDKGATATTTTTGSGTLTYESSNTAIATVNSSTGEVTGVKAGYATIIAYNAADTAKAVTKSYTVEVGPAAGDSYTWTSADFFTYYGSGATIQKSGDAFGEYNTLMITGGKFANNKSNAHTQINNGTIIYVPVDSSKADKTSLEFNFSYAGNLCSGIKFNDSSDVIALSDNAVKLENCTDKTTTYNGITCVKCEFVVPDVDGKAQSTYIGGDKMIIRTVSN